VPVAATAKTFTYAIELSRDGRMSAEGEGTLELDDAWSPDHLLLAALARCVLESLRYHAGLAGLDAIGSAEARGLVTKREEDGRYAFVEIECSLEAELDATPPEDELQELLAKAEHDCFVGASLTVAPRYRWRVNGNVAAA
jgi:organic hydroperoxide reductase OsmC/OhrA